MKLQFASDLHLEFHENSRWLRQNPLTPVGDVLLLAGDIGYLGDDNYSKHPFWSWAADHFEQVIAIPGNHELYKDFDINELHEGWALDIRPNVKAYYNQTLHLNNDVDLVLSTLWAHVPPEDAFYTERGVTDFHLSGGRAEGLPPGCSDRITVKFFHLINKHNERKIEFQV
jgi:hypothetical protein